MDDVRTPVATASLYEADEHAWYFTQIAALREARLGDLDREHLAEFLEDMAKRNTREIQSRLTVLLVHILKSIHQPERRSRSWVVTIVYQQDELRGIFRDSATLARAAPELLRDVYPKAVRLAELETGLPRGTVPASCAWTLDEILAYEPPAQPGESGPPDRP